MIQKHRAEEFESRFKKAVSVLNNAINYMRIDTSQELTVENFSSGTFKNIFKKYYKVIEDCGNRGCYDNATPQYRNFSNNAVMYDGYFNDGNFVLSDGMTIFVDQDNYDIQISVDINGYKKKPNRYGYDVFTFTLSSNPNLYSNVPKQGNGKLYPAGHEYTRWYNSALCSKTSDSSANGATCAYQASKNPNYFKELL